MAESNAERINPWVLLNKKFDDDAVPVVLDKNTAMYSLHKYKGVGETIVVPDDRRGEIQFRIVGLELEMQRMPPPLLLFPPELALPPLTWKPSSTALELVPVPFNTW